LTGQLQKKYIIPLYLIKVKLGAKGFGKGCDQSNSQTEYSADIWVKEEKEG